MATNLDPNKIEDTKLMTWTTATPTPTSGNVSASVPSATNISNTISSTPAPAPITANPNALQSWVKWTNYDTGKGELFDGTTATTPADEGGFWSGIDYTGIDKGITQPKTETPAAIPKWQEMWYTNVWSYNARVDPLTWLAPNLSTTGTTWTSTDTTWAKDTGKSVTTDVTTWKTPDQIKTESIDSILKSLDPNNQLTAEEKQSIRDALGSEDAASYTAALLWKSNILLDKANTAINAYRLNRDTTLQSNRNQQVYDQNVKNITAQYDTAIEKAKQNVSDTMNNMSVIAGTSGRLQSKNLTNAIHQQLDNSKKNYNDLVSAKDRDLASLASDLKYKTDMLSNEYNDKMTAQMDDILKTIKTLDTAWELDTAQGLTNAKSFLRKSLDATQASTQTYYDSLKYLNDYFTQQKTDMRALNKIDSDVTKTMNDWYLYNANGSKVTNEKWEFLQITKPTTGTLISDKPITLANGSQAMLFQKPDWTIETQVLKWTEPAQMWSDIISHYAQLLATGTLKVADIKDLPPITQQAIISRAAWMPQGGDYQSVVLKDADGNDIPATFNKSDWTYIINWKSFSSWEISSTWLTTPGGTGENNLVQTNPQSIIDYSTTLRGKTKLQCWELVNDYVKQITGTKWTMWDTIDSKYKTISKIWESSSPVVGWLFAFGWYGWAGHTWIVQSINPDWSIEVLEAGLALEYLLALTFCSCWDI